MRVMGRSGSVYKAGCEGVMTHMEIVGGYVKQNGLCQGGHEMAGQNYCVVGGDNHLQHNSFHLPSHGHPDTSHSVPHTCPRPTCGSLPLHNQPWKLTHPYPVTLLLIGLSYFQAKPSLICIPQLFLNLVIIYLLAYEDGTDRAFRNVGI